MSSNATKVAAAVRDQADWRSHTHDEYPDDQRNANCAAALRLLADWIEGLPADDPLQERFGYLHLDYTEPNIPVMFGDEARSFVSQLEFRNVPRVKPPKRIGELTDEQFLRAVTVHLLDLMDKDDLSDELGPFLVEVAAGSEGWRRALIGGRALQDQVEDYEADAVEAARADGATWQQIAGLLGITPQTAWQRYKQHQPTS